MTDSSPVDWHGDGSVAFQIDDTKIRWRPPKVKHVRTHRNRYSQILTEQRTNLEPFTFKDRDGTIITRQHIASLTSKKEVERLTKAMDAFNDQLDPDELQTVSETNTSLIVEWVQNVHKDLQLEGTLPADADDWPAWLATRYFMDELVRHWSSNPFV